MICDDIIRLQVNYDYALNASIVEKNIKIEPRSWWRGHWAQCSVIKL